MADKQYKSKDDKLIEKRYKEKYMEKVQNVMNLIAKSNVFYQDQTITIEDVVLPAGKWFIGDYTVDSDFQTLCSIEANDIEVPILQLKTCDYKKIVKACEKRHATLIQQRKLHKNR